MPAPGPSLLDEAESSMLGDFFDQFGSAAFDQNVVLMDKAFPRMADPGPVAPALAFHSRAPAILAYSSAPSPPPVEVIASAGSNGYRLATPISPGRRSLHDVLVAATELMPNSHHQPWVTSTGPCQPHSFAPPLRQGLQHQQQHHHYHHTNESSRSPIGVTSSGVPTTTYSFLPHLSRPPPTPCQSVQAEHLVPTRASGGMPRQCDVTGLSTVSATAGPPPADLSPRTLDVRWGSDASFVEHGYVGMTPLHVNEDVAEEMLQQVECLVGPGSSDGRRRPGLRDPVGRPASSSSSTDGPRPHPTATLPREGEQGPTMGEKRSLSETNVDGGDNVHRSGLANKRSRTKAAGKRSSCGMGSSSPGAAASTNVRENLTDAQKRSNHILSEQKRRNLIKQGFEDLGALVPDIKGTGYSKSVVLAQAGHWLEDLLKGNDELRELLASLQETSAM